MLRIKIYSIFQACHIILGFNQLKCSPVKIIGQLILQINQLLCTHTVKKIFVRKYIRRIYKFSNIFQLQCLREKFSSYVITTFNSTIISSLNKKNSSLYRISSWNLWNLPSNRRCLARAESSILVLRQRVLRNGIPCVVALAPSDPTQKTHLI